MNRNTLFLGLIAGFSALSMHAQVNLSNGLLVHMPFTGNAKDVSGNAKNGTVNNAVLTNDRCGNVNSAYSFNGTNAYIEIPVSSLQTQYCSYSLWISADEIPGTGEYTYPFAIGASGGGQNIALCNNAMTGWAGGAYNNGSPSISLVAKGTQPTVDSWYHVVFVRDTTKIKIYINGVLNTNEASYGGITPATGGNTPNFGTSPKALLGNRDLNSQFFFKGMIDDVRLYNRVLTADEIDSLYHEPCFKTGIAEVFKNGMLNVYPNPSNGQFSVETENNGGTLTLVNSLGQVVYSEVCENQATVVNVSDLSSGIYTIMVQNTSGILTRKITISK